MPLHVELVSPERILFSGEADMVIARTTDGDIAFQPGHAPFLGVLQIGGARIKLTDGREEVAAVHGGFVEVFDDRVIILSDVAELSGQIDVARAERARSRAEERLQAEHDAEAEVALRRAHVRIELGT